MQIPKRDPRVCAKILYRRRKLGFGGNITPVFFIKDAKNSQILFIPKRHPKTNLKSHTMMWDFGLKSESLHQVLIFERQRNSLWLQTYTRFWFHTFR